MNNPIVSPKAKIISVSIIEKLEAFSKKFDLKISEKLVCKFICIPPKIKYI
jgi:hypothetical protein